MRKILPKTKLVVETTSTTPAKDNRMIGSPGSDGRDKPFPSAPYQFQRELNRFDPDAS